MVEWIEIKLDNAASENTSSSPPSWWSGLKSLATGLINKSRYVSTLVVEWIEILSPLKIYPHLLVSTLVVEWIEIVRPLSPA